MLQYKSVPAAVTNFTASICKHASEPQSMLLYMATACLQAFSQALWNSFVEICTGPCTGISILPEAFWDTGMMQHIMWLPFQRCNLLSETASTATVGTTAPVSSPARFEKFSHSLQ